MKNTKEHVEEQGRNDTKKSSISKITQTAIFAALIFAATQFIKFPLPLGYANMGDCFVILAGWVIGGGYGCVAAAVGSMLADALSGYLIYVPASLIIKAIMAFAAYKGFKFAKEFRGVKRHIAVIISSVIAELIMVAGYLIYETAFYGIGGAAASVVGNMLQGLIAVVTSNLIFFKKVVDK